MSNETDLTAADVARSIVDRIRQRKPAAPRKPPPNGKQMTDAGPSLRAVRSAALRSTPPIVRQTAR